VDAATAITLRWNATGFDVYDITDHAHLIADHAKYIYAVGSRDTAAMQYRLAELAIPAGSITRCTSTCNGPLLGDVGDAVPGTTCAVRDDRTLDGGWDWSDNTYSDGRRVMAQVRVENWYELDCNWPYNAGMAGDGPIQERPRGSVCQIAPGAPSS
jgi:hypothetical protein